MDDFNNTNINPADAGQDAQNNQQAEPKTFTQEDIERIIAERLKREREKYKDYAELKKAAEELQKLKEAQMTEQEKLQAKLQEYERILQEKEREAKEAQIQATKVKVLTELGLPLDLAGRIFGEDEQAIRRDAETLKKLLGIASKPIGGGTNPTTTSSGMQNPWHKDTFNLTLQGKILRENPALAQKLMAEAGIK
ncbi:protein of unknown function [Carboxydocella sporoproducens DSM 16521]|uniref:Phage minor structural protein GP20 n=2 Tax=Carboxydocella TaxID=178898 RepID=A0A1T4QGG7_9FIRM|nr:MULTISPECIES: DUF4355 domain-containing protein [Carboxydocella]AVX21603.1 protein of unknown function (DUF4355) [Carboxydocella thermautotrophica]SKA02378.1 protein of unknown function [Carboxydocella sporoproducens DSM 16521]